MDTAPTTFTKLNLDWNAEPNAPDPQIRMNGQELILTFLINPWQYTGFKEGDRAQIIFSECWRYRLGPTNDEGWYRGQCRFSSLAPAWGEFYELEGDLLLDLVPGEWVLTSKLSKSSRHFLFYFRDHTFECDASSWTATFQ